ncbi:hypothetical protein M8J76_001333 [Diaphorina citri]|nr:hypothetical protein M8J76_001333 [Diaphorina citri]
MPYSCCTIQYPIALHTNFSIFTLLHSTTFSSSQSYLPNLVSFSFGPGLTVRSYYGYHVYVYVMWYDGWSIRCPSASGKCVYLRLDCVCVAPRVKLSVGKSLHAIHRCTFSQFWKCGGWSIRCPSASGKCVYLRLDCVCVAPRAKLSVVPTSAANISSPAQKIWNYKRADWALFRENVNFNVDLSDVPDIDKVISEFNKKILYAANIAIPEKKLPVNRLPVPWWDDEVKTVIAERRKCLRALRRNPTGANRIAFMRARAVARKMLKTKKRKSWSDFVSSIDHSMSSGKDQNSHPKKGMRRRQIRKSGEKRMKMKEKDTFTLQRACLRILTSQFKSNSPGKIDPPSPGGLLKKGHLRAFRSITSMVGRQHPNTNPRNERTGDSDEAKSAKQ